MKTIKAIAVTASLAVAALILTAASGFYGSGGTQVLSASSSTNSVNITTTRLPVWPSAIGSNAVLASVIYTDPTNATPFSVAGKELSLNFRASFAGGTGGSGSTSNVIIRLAYDDNPTAITMTTNGVSSRTPTLWSWSIPVTIAAGVGSVDVVTNLTAAGTGLSPSTAHANWYVYDINWFCTTNGSPFMTNYGVYANSK